MGLSKAPVKLRQRLLKTGNTTLYLDIYVKGRRKYEYLNLYLIPETRKEDKAKNRETMRLAEAVRAKRVVEIQNGRYGFDNPTQGDVNLLDYFRHLIQEKVEANNITTAQCWENAYIHLARYCSPKTKLSDVTRDFVVGFREYLITRAYKRDGNRIAASTQQNYFTSLRTAIRRAYNDNLIAHNPITSVPTISHDEPQRNYLTIDEIKKLVAVSDMRVLHRAFLFSCLTGLRRSDITKLQWGEVNQQGEFTRIIFRQKKTRGQEYIDVNPQAAKLMGERRNNNELVFGGLSLRFDDTRRLKPWMMQAGITKKITFHCARHTFAVMMLDLGADIYTVSKLLGHKSIKNTQIYAKILDKKKQAAAMLIPPIF